VGEREIDMFSLANKTALVTGASSGFGAHFAKELSKCGARVAIAARRKERLEALAKDIRDAGGEAFPIEMDVTKPDSVEAGFESLSDVWRVAKAAANALMEAGKPGSIVNIASITAFRPSHTTAAYSSSKAAVDHLTRIMAVELARYKIRVNALAPGYFVTEINEDFFETPEGEKMLKRITMRRTGELRELTAPLLLLASDAGSYMTGSTIIVDGGHTLTPL